MTDELDNVIASMNEAEPLVTETPVKEETPKVEEPKEAETKDEADKGEEETGDVPFPKKAVNKIDRLERKLYKERAARAALEAEIAKYTQNQAQPSKNQSVVNDGSPKEDDFDNYSDFLEAKLLHKIKQEQTAQEKTKQEQALSAQKQEWVASREQEIANKVEAHKEVIPDFVQVVEAYADIADEFPEHIVQAFYEADDAPLAFYNLAKDGKLEALSSMSPYKAAMEIALAQNKKAPVVNRVSGAPSPIKPVSGRGASTKDTSEMSGEELLKKYGFKY